jgi:uncharacterized membrane protein
MQIAGIHFELVTCHRKPERSFFLKGRQFPVCARCTGIYIGYFTYPFFLFDLAYLNFYISVALIMPTVIDGLIQALSNRESNNVIRLVTGIAAGTGFISLASITGERIYMGILFLTNY